MGWGGERVVNKIKPYDDFILTFGSVDILRLDEPDFADHVEETPSELQKTGIRGLKLWKNISLGMKDKAGKYIPIDDKRLKPIWDWSAELDLPIVIHIADPVAFFRPVDQYNERWEELQGSPRLVVLQAYSLPLKNSWSSRRAWLPRILIPRSSLLTVGRTARISAGLEPVPR